MIKASAEFAASRFGYGLRSGKPISLGDDPAAALLDEAISQSEATSSTKGLKSSAEAIREVRLFQQKRQAQASARRATAEADSAPQGASMEASDAGPMKPLVLVHHVIYEQEFAEKLTRYQTAPIGFFERLVDFWSNHFALEVRKSPIVRASIGAFERETIRPHILGRFEDMLLAVARHPAMLAYLDNWASAGVNSPVGKRNDKRGLNENFGRELLELHTLGVDGGYEQADVRALANALSGWTFGWDLRKPKRVGRFLFQRGMHEPGPVTVLGKTYPQADQRQAAAIIADLARSPATAHHLARKMVQAFVADDPPAQLVDRLAKAYLASDGDLLAVTEALLTAPESWQAPRTKLRSPQEFLFSAVRALDFDLEFKEARRVLLVLGQMIWEPGSPAGFAIDSRHWLAADALTNRLDVARYLAVHTKPRDPTALSEAILGDLLSEPTREAIHRAESPSQAYALFLMSPEFQRR